MLSGLKRLRMTGDLVVLAFFFLLRVGEYTPSSGPRRTVPLRRQDIKLWRNSVILSHSEPLAVLLTADAVTICLENQKNGHKNATLHHTTSGDAALDPVRSAARLVFEIQQRAATTPIGTYTDAAGAVRQVQAADVRAALRTGAIGDNLEAHGYDLSRIGSHSLRSGGAMHLKLAGYDDGIIKKLGRWSSNTYLHYIQTQIGEFSAGIARNMARVLRFHNVGA